MSFDRKAYHREYDALHRVAHREASRRSRQKSRLMGRAAYASLKEYMDEVKTECGCMRCGEKDPIVLDFHHRDPKAKKYPISAMARFSQSALEAEIAKCDILCANCHRRVEYERRRLQALIEQSDQPES